MNRTEYKWSASEQLVAIAYCFLVVFGWWVTNDLIGHSPNLRAFCDFMATFVPQIDRATTLGGLTGGNANRVIYSVLWVLAIFSIPIFVWKKCKKVQRDGFDSPRSRITWWQAIVFPLFSVFVAWDGMYFQWMNPELRIIHFGLVNRVGAGVFAPILVFGPPVFLFAGLLLVWGLVTGRIIVGVYATKGRRDI